MSISRRAALALPLLVAAARSGRAEAYPGRALKFVVPWPAGGVADTIARVTAEQLSERLGQRIGVGRWCGIVRPLRSCHPRTRLPRPRILEAAVAAELVTPSARDLDHAHSIK